VNTLIIVSLKLCSDGFPIQKESYRNKYNYDENYFCYERYIKYLDVLATQLADVLELIYSLYFWPEQFCDKKLYKAQLLIISCDVYEINFK
jgi:hypothetical protein